MVCYKNLRLVVHNYYRKAERKLGATKKCALFSGLENFPIVIESEVALCRDIPPHEKKIPIPKVENPE